MVAEGRDPRPRHCCGGLSVLRFWNDDILHRTETVLERIHDALGSCVPSPFGERARVRAFFFPEPRVKHDLSGENLRINGDRLWESLMEMAKVGPGVAGGNNRQTLTDSDRDGRELFQRWCEARG